MNDKKRCPTCGSRELSEDGLCRKCLLVSGMNSFASARPLRIRCPHCDIPIEILSDSQPDVTCPSCQSSFGFTKEDGCATHDPEQLGRFLVEECIGIGAYGTVYRAIDPELDRVVAIKVPRQQADASLILKEAKAVARLSHPNIVSVLEVGKHENTFYIVADFVDGQSLADWLSDNTPTIADSVELCKRIARALEHAHQAGIVHRDLKPANILLQEGTSGTAHDGPARHGDSGAHGLRHFEPKVTDFGLAKRDASEVTMTVPGKILGTPMYMSPEQASGDGFQADARADVYSLGVILFEMLTGEPPFRGKLQMLLEQVRDVDAPSPRRLNDRVPRDLETITLKCLEKRPSARYQSADELAHELQRFSAGEPIQARRISNATRVLRWCGRNRTMAGLLAMAVGLLIFIALGSILAYHYQLQQSETLRAAQYGDQMKAAFAGVDRLVESHGFRQTLRSWHPEVAGCDLRGWEWYLLNSFLHRGVCTIDAKCGTVEDIDWSSDGRTLVAVGGDGSVSLWDGDTHREIVRKNGAHEGPILCVAWSPSGDRFATGGSDRVVRLWNDRCQELAELPHRNRVRHVEWKNGRVLISGNDDCHVSQWDTIEASLIESTKVERRSSAGQHGILSLAWSDRHGLAVGTDNTGLVLIDKDGARWRDPDRNVVIDDIHSASWQEDLLALGGKGRNVAIWNAKTKQAVHSFDCRHFVMDVTWHPTFPLLLVASHDSTVRVWDHESRQLRAFIGHRSAVLGVSWRPGTREFASAGDDGTVRIWSMKKPTNMQVYPGECFAWSPDSSKLACVVGQEVRIINLGSNEIRAFPDRLHEHAGQRAMAWSPDGKRIATSYYPKKGGDSRILIWDAVSGKRVREISKKDTGWATYFSWHPDNRKLLCHGSSFTPSSMTRVFDADSGEILAETPNCYGLMSEWSPDGKRIMTMIPMDQPVGPAGHLMIWDFETGERLLHIKDTPVLGGCWSPDGQFVVAGTGDGSVHIWDSRTKELHRTLRGHAGWVTVPTWSQDGSRLATIDTFGVVKVWNPQTGQELITLDTQIRAVPAGLKWSPDGKKLVAKGHFGERTIRVWDATQGYRNADAPLNDSSHGANHPFRFF